MSFLSFLPFKTFISIYFNLFIRVYLLQSHIVERTTTMKRNVKRRERKLQKQILPLYPLHLSLPQGKPFTLYSFNISFATKKRHLIKLKGPSPDLSSNHSPLTNSCHAPFSLLAQHSNYFFFSFVAVIY